jgi:hypothetical protein
MKVGEVQGYIELRQHSQKQMVAESGTLRTNLTVCDFLQASSDGDLIPDSPKLEEFG